MTDTGANEEMDGEVAVECDVCGQNHITEDCPMLGLSTSDFKAQISRARLTVPHYLGIIDYSDGEVGIIATEPISNKTQLGPFEAKKTCNIDRDDVFILKILSADGNTISLDSSSENHCNWMALVQVATTTEEQNCMAYQLGINIYFNTTKDIAAGTPLKVWYAWKYAQKLGKPIEPDGKTKSMLGADISSWRHEAANQAEPSPNDEGILEAAAYLSSVLPSSSSGSAIETIIVKQEAQPGRQVYKCSKCLQVFFNQSDYAIHLRGHLMPSSMLADSRGGKRGRPWNRAGVIRPLGKRGPGRPRKVTSSKEPGEVVPKVFGPPKRRGRPRKVQPEQMATPDAEETGDSGVKPEETGGQAQSAAGEESTADGAEVGGPVDADAAGTTTEVEAPGAASTPVSTGETPKDCEKPVGQQAEGDSQAGEEPAPERDGSTQTPIEGVDEKDPSPAEPVDQALQPTPSTPTPSLSSPEVVKTPRKRGRPPKNKTAQGEITSPPPPPPPTPALSRRVQPRRTLKGKRTSSFRYPGESSSDEEEVDKAKGRNVLKRAIKAVEYSDDDIDEDDDDQLEDGEVKGEEGVHITLQTQEGLVLSKAPVILLDENTGKTQTLDPATLSIVTTGVDSSGQQVVIIRSNAPTTTTTTTTYASIEGEDTPLVDTDATSQPQTRESEDTPQGGLAALVDAALSSQKILKSSLELTQEADEGGETDEGGEEMTSDDPDWKGSVIKREASPRKRRPKRRRGDDPDLEQLEESIQIVEGPNGSKEYACSVCAKRFQQLKYLKMHLPAHTDKFLCNDCGRRFARHESLQKHICEDWLVLVEKIESGEDGSIIFRCKECGRSFPQMDHARRHASMHRGTWACAKCQRTFPKRQMLLEHKCGQPADMVESGDEDSNANAANDSTGEVEGEGDFPCDICKQSFRNAKYLFRHMAMHTELFKCESCGKCYSRKDSLQRHVLKCCPQLAEDYSVFACDKCKKTFGTRLGLENHVLNCGKFQCTLCRIAFFSEEDLLAHKCEGKIIDDAAGVQFPCKECGKTFASLPYLARHEASHHAAFECDICKKVFVRREELTWHAPVCLGVSTIERDGVTLCDVCQSQFTDVRLFREHYQVHTHPYRCDKCGKRFIKVGTLHTHKCDNVVAGSTGVEEGVWQCEMCEKTFKNERYLARHKQLHGLPSFDCEHCGKKFIRKDYLNDHKCVLPDGTSVRVVRKKNRLYIRDDLVCPHCNKTFSSRSNLNKHVRVHGEKQAECHVCGKKFHYESYLKLHIATVHDRQFQYQCSHCGKILFSKTGLIAHIKQFHQDTVKLYPCPKCGKAFRQKGNMRTHLYSHTKERTFKCQMCPKSFKYPDQLNRHHLEHTMQEKIKCMYCDKRFVRTSELRQHMRLFHSGVIYTCHVCHESCAHKHTIVRHYRRKHPELADVFEKQPDFLETLQKPVDKSAAMSSSSLSTQRLPIQLTAPHRDGEQKPRIIRVMADGQEQEYIITSAPSTSTEAANLEDVLSYATVTTEQGHEVLPQEAVQALQDMSGAVFETDASGMIQQTIEGPDGQQTVIILQVVSQDELGNMQEVAHVDGEQISIQEIAMDANELGIEVPIEVTTETTEGAESMSMTAGSMLDSGAMESVVIDSNVVETAQDGAITLVTSAMGTHMVDSSSMETGTMAASTMETVETMETVPVSSTDVTVASSEQEAKYV